MTDLVTRLQKVDVNALDKMTYYFRVNTAIRNLIFLTHTGYKDRPCQGHCRLCTVIIYLLFKPRMFPRVETKHTPWKKKSIIIITNVHWIRWQTADCKRLMLMPWVRWETLSRRLQMAESRRSCTLNERTHIGQVTAESCHQCTVDKIVDGVTGWLDWQSVGLKIQRPKVRTPSRAQEKIVSFFSESKMFCWLAVGVPNPCVYAHT